MALQQQQDLLARLYTDPNVRQQFLNEPSSFADDLGLSDEDAEALAKAAGYEVNWFADSLVNKRLREVRKLLPISERVIGRDEFERRFREFAAGFAPTTVKKHLEEALAFAEVLFTDDRIDLARFESRRLRHGAVGQRISGCLLRNDPRSSDVYSGFGFWIAVGAWSRIFFVSRGRT